MQKIITLIISLLFAYGSIAQDTYHVSTNVEKKKALLEEFTGQGCYWCRDGHAVASQLLTKFGSNAYVIAIHTGHLSGSFYGIDLRTIEGDAIGEYFDCEKAGYPSGMINRHDFEGNGIYTRSRSLWLDDAAQITAEDAPVNLWQKAVYDGNTNKLSIRIEGYFTAEQQKSDQRLTVMITQDHIIGYQNGGGTDYEHNHVLRATLTNAFGDEIGEAVKGNYFSKEYEYSLPESLGGEDVMPEDLMVIAFVSAGNEEIQNVTGGKPEYINYGTTLKGELLPPTFEMGTKWGYNFFDVKISNRSAAEISTATFEVTVNGETTEQTIECDIPQFGEEEVRVPAVISYADKGKTAFTLRLTKLNNEPVDAVEYAGSFQMPKKTDTTINIQIKTDACAGQNHFFLRDADGRLVREFGPYEDNKIATYEEQITVEDGKTYCIEVTDANGDGIAYGSKGYLIVKSDSGILIDQFYTINGWGVRSFFITDNASGIKDVDNNGQAAAEKMFSVSGQRLSVPPVRGIYIRNGKKILR